ncbi:M20/M25/M40 family metallo-hydrolase [candidate division KSB3 bacterium]|uniref:M20/M25/M40 family metallo-hydrolase n=1 Tax=candidate division KSB3 bacterium TaxID=2044937 RepID=A0A9D5JTV1_9BACT|nr:M20/M25/M40 family metallo-hydrolase [candidate division KSB3 bacterium]MBD3324065.1 M20/M25/M40 family metallo-hydrolase [candidate division KSB3 bacterium]
MNTQLYADLVQAIDIARVSEHLKAMIAIKSENPFHEDPRPGYREQEMGEYYAEQMHQLGLDVTTKDVRPSRPNVFGRRQGTAGQTTLMLEGHLDTARTDGYPDAYEVKEEGGKIFGRGACDMKAGLAAYLEVVRLLKEADIRLKGALILTGVMDEEFQMIGAKDVGMHGPKADWGIVGEPCDLTICPASKGRVSTYINTFGKAAHSSVPECGENAIIRMGRVIHAFADYNDELLHRQPHPLLGHGRFNLGVIQGGVQVNMVPDSCGLEVDRRTLPGESQDSVYQELRQRLNPLQADDPAFRYEITDPTWLVPANDVSPSAPIVQSLLAAYAQVLSRPTEVAGFVAASDAPHFGFPTVICGPGAIAQAHTVCEFVAVEQLVQAVQMYLWVVLDLLA